MGDPILYSAFVRLLYFNCTHLCTRCKKKKKTNIATNIQPIKLLKSGHPNKSRPTLDIGCQIGKKSVQIRYSIDWGLRPPFTATYSILSQHITHNIGIVYLRIFSFHTMNFFELLRNWIVSKVESYRKQIILLESNFFQNDKYPLNYLSCFELLSR